MQSYKYYYMVSPQTVFTCPFHHAKLQILLKSGIVSVYGNTMCYLNYREAEVQVLKRT